MSDIMKPVTQTIKKLAVVGKKCDVCNASILPTSRTFPREEKPFYEITTHHSDWGNDSIESFSYYHACSISCAMRFTEQYLAENYNGINSTTIEITHENGWMVPEGEDA